MRRLLELLERRAAVFELIGATRESRRPFVRVGGELADPALRDVALVGAPYGLANRSLGAVGLIGPVRMEYARTVTLVEYLGRALSRKIEESNQEPSA